MARPQRREHPAHGCLFADHIRHENAEFWALERSGELIGELYVFKSLPDRDFADGRTKAYLCAFLVREADRGKGLGSQLLSAVLARLKANGFRYATIGVEKGDEANLRLYRRHGFSVTIKECRLDPALWTRRCAPGPVPAFCCCPKRCNTDPAGKEDGRAGGFVPTLCARRQTTENRSLTAPGSALVGDLFLYAAAGARRVIGGPAASRSAPGAAFTGF